MKPCVPNMVQKDKTLHIEVLMSISSNISHKLSNANVFPNNCEESKMDDSIQNLEDNKANGTESKEVGNDNVIKNCKIQPMKFVFYGLSALSYGVLFILPISNTLPIYNANHLFAWFSIFFSATYILYNIHLILFSSDLCELRIKYRLMNSIYYVPHEISKKQQKPIGSISMMAHVRGTSYQKWHTLFVTLGSCCVISGAILKLFENNYHDQLQRVATYFILLCGIGGIITANVEVWSSSVTFSKRVNRSKSVIHVIGVALYFFGGNLGFFLYRYRYNEIDLLSTVLLILFILMIIISRMFKYHKSCIFKYILSTINVSNENQSKHLVSNISKLNIASEIAASIPSVIAVCYLLYEFGNEM